MAKIKFGMMMTDARGKLGGQVFSKNRAGSYVRTKTTPANPRSTAQLFNRSILASLSIGWNALSLSAIASWNEAVANWAKTDIFGDLRNPTGKNLYIALNKNLLQSGQSIVPLPPAKIEVPIVPVTGIVVNETTSTITLTGLASVPANTVLQITATQRLANGQNYVKNKLRVISYIATGAITATDVFTDYQDKFGAIVVGQRIAFELKYINSNGQAGIPVKFFATAV